MFGISIFHNSVLELMVEFEVSFHNSHLLVYCCIILSASAD